MAPRGKLTDFPCDGLFLFSLHSFNGVWITDFIMGTGEHWAASGVYAALTL